MEGIISKAYTLGIRFVKIAAEYIHGLDLQQVSAKTVVRRFKSLVGVSPVHCGLLWMFVEEQTYKMEPLREMKHLLWTLDLLWCDSTENILHTRWVADEKTLRKYIYLFLEALSTLGVIDWQCRKDIPTASNIYVSVDGTDFRIKEPQPFDTGWYSEKFNGPAVKYEVAVCIATGWIVWVYGPWRGGRNDHEISMLGLQQLLDNGERYIADKGYHSSSALQPNNAWTFEERHYMRVVRGRHETINRLFKRFRSIGNTFKRDHTKHGLFMYSIANIIQVGIMFGEIQPFEVDMDEPQWFNPTE